MKLSDSDRSFLLSIAKKSVEYGAEHHKLIKIDYENCSKKLLDKAAVFVTLFKDKKLRGCIGSLEPKMSLAENVVKNAYAAAFEDYRFSSVEKSELSFIEYHISILNKPEEILFSSEKDLLKKIRPGIDGLILEEKNKRATFLPSVWNSLNTTTDFLNELKKKAGFTANYFSKTIKVFRYTVENIP
ncbi:MAG: AmmeMemoRadiSam system protein A [Spirochaetia bacterium]|nr:AmmeMemoRadiSam system protein A [Spirochaetia bacterium]